MSQIFLSRFTIRISFGVLLFQPHVTARPASQPASQAG
eukprot:COSAG06_NODE_25254_length_641_cov_1.022140_2_plen_37_part_01